MKRPDGSCYYTNHIYERDTKSNTLNKTKLTNLCLMCLKIRLNKDVYRNGQNDASVLLQDLCRDCENTMIISSSIISLTMHTAGQRPLACFAITSVLCLLRPRKLLNLIRPPNFIPLPRATAFSRIQSVTLSDQRLSCLRATCPAHLFFFISTKVSLTPVCSLTHYALFLSLKWTDNPLRARI